MQYQAVVDQTIETNQRMQSKPHFDVYLEQFHFLVDFMAPSQPQRSLSAFRLAGDNTTLAVLVTKSTSTSEQESGF
jgi:hypothetical protein